MPSPFRRLLLAACICLITGLAGCGLFKEGDCDCPAFSQTQAPSPEQPMACGEEVFAVDSAGETEAYAY